MEKKKYLIEIRADRRLRLEFSCEIAPSVPGGVKEENSTTAKSFCKYRWPEVEGSCKREMAVAIFAEFRYFAFSDRTKREELRTEGPVAVSGFHILCSNPDGIHLQDSHYHVRDRLKAVIGALSI